MFPFPVEYKLVLLVCHSTALLTSGRGTTLLWEDQK